MSYCFRAFAIASVLPKLVFLVTVITLIAGCSESQEPIIARAIFHNCTAAWLEEYGGVIDEYYIVAAEKPMPVKQNRSNYGTDIIYASRYKSIYTINAAGCMTDKNFQVLFMAHTNITRVDKEEWKDVVQKGIHFRNRYDFD